MDGCRDYVGWMKALLERAEDAKGECRKRAAVLHQRVVRRALRTNISVASLGAAPRRRGSIPSE